MLSLARIKLSPEQGPASACISLDRIFSKKTRRHLLDSSEYLLVSITIHYLFEFVKMFIIVLVSSGVDNQFLGFLCS